MLKKPLTPPENIEQFKRIDLCMVAVKLNHLLAANGSKYFLKILVSAGTMTILRHEYHETLIKSQICTH